MKKYILILVLIIAAITVCNAQGKYIKDGKAYVANSQFIEKFDSFIRTTDRELWPYFADVRNALLSGRTVTYDSFNCELSGNYFHLLNARQKRKMRKNGVPLTNIKVRLAKLMIYKLANFNP